MDLRFGVTILPSASGRSDPVEEARHAEALGFDLVSIWDHPLGDTPSLETWTLLTWIAARTARVGLLTNVLGLPHRAPIMVAKMAETLDRMSGGRLILGLGAGSGRHDHEALGMPHRGPRERVEALAEAVELVREAWRPGPVSFRGRHLRVSGVPLEPKPDRPIPIWLGTYGDRALEVTGRLADGWLPSLAYVGDLRARTARVRRAIEAAGRDPADLTLAINVGVRVGVRAPEDPTRVGGPPEQVVERMAEIVELGFSVLNLWVSGVREEQRERLAHEVVPALRERVR